MDCNKYDGRTYNKQYINVMTQFLKECYDLLSKHILKVVISQALKITKVAMQYQKADNHNVNNQNVDSLIIDNQNVDSTKMSTT